MVNILFDCVCNSVLNKCSMKTMYNMYSIALLTKLESQSNTDYWFLKDTNNSKYCPHSVNNAK